MRLLVCGGRNFEARNTVFRVLDLVHKKRGITLVIHGDATGADRLGRDWAQARGIGHMAFPADWETHGRKAGIVRNQLMLDVTSPDGVVAFPGGRGTMDMMNRAEAAGIKVWRPLDTLSILREWGQE